MKRRSTFVACVVLAASSSLAQTTIQFTAIHSLPSNEVELIWSSDTNRLFAILGTTDLRTWDNAFCAGILQPSAVFGTYRQSSTIDSTPCFFRVLASPPLEPLVICHTNIGTAGDDTQIVIGTTNMDYVIQFGEGSNDIQYASTRDDDDWVAQFGGMGSDTQTVRSGTADDWAFQDGGPGQDIHDTQAGDGHDRIIQKGGADADNMNVKAGDGLDVILQKGGFGDDSMRVDGGFDDDTTHMFGGDGEDALTYDVSDGSDTARIDGGNDSDVLTVNYLNQHFAIRLPDGTDLYTSGVPGTVITVMGLETIHAVKDGTTNWTGSAP